MELLGDEARLIALDYFRAWIDVMVKGDLTPVTAADVEIEARLLDIATANFPDDALVGEEAGGAIGDQRSWVFDPIDGTKSFVCGLPLFSTLVAVLEKRSPVWGMIEVPAMGERWIGNGRETTLNGNGCGRAIVLPSARRDLLRPILLCSRSPKLLPLKSCQLLPASRDSGPTRTAALLASGCIDLVAESDLKVHDVMALIPIVEGAGGLITDWNGDAVRERFNGSILAACTPELHGQALAILKSELDHHSAGLTDSVARA